MNTHHLPSLLSIIGMAWAYHLNHSYLIKRQSHQPNQHCV
ncbi:hypothetical protein EJK51_0725 [Moraxella catarrhalis]|nr:hypothetical protein EJK52_0727 [Moraxella catarrhalis]AZQ91888.1 hypothetical protein EJK51_0725 [Moraxella catarrhalis]